MNDKLDKYLEIAKEVHLANVPLDKSDAESLLGKSGRGTAQNFVKRFINFFGRHLFMTLTSIIAVILTVIYLFSPFGMNEVEDNVILSNSSIKQKIDSTVIKDKKRNVDLIYSDAVVQINSIKNENMIYENEYNSDSLDLSLISFDYERWSFERKIKETYLNPNSNNSFKKNIIKVITKPLTNVEIIKCITLLKDLLDEKVKLYELNSICYLEINDYFDQLNEFIINQNKNEVNFDIIRYIYLYANMNKKLIDNYSDLVKIKRNGLKLPKDVLERLGVVFTNSSISVPNDELFINSYDIESHLKYCDSLPNNFKNLILNKEFLVKKVKVFSLNKNLKVNSNTIFKRFDSSENFHKTSPILFNDWLELENHHPLLHFGNQSLKNIYNKVVEYSKFKDIELNKEDSSSVHNSEMKLNNYISLSIMKYSLKFRYLIPVDVQIPYYGFTKEQLDTMPNATFVTLWYYPNEEFLSALPVEIRKQLEKEMKLVELVRKGEIQPEAACNEVKESKSLLGLCNLTNSAITNLNIYPNPALDFINLKFDILDNRFYKIILSDATGKYVKDLNEWTESQKNEINLTFPATELQNGSYIIQIITEKGEKLMSKFVVKR